MTTTFESAVRRKTFELYQQEPYSGMFAPVPPREPVAASVAQPCDGSRTALRHPREIRGLGHASTTQPTVTACGPDGCC